MKEPTIKPIIINEGSESVEEILAEPEPVTEMEFGKNNYLITTQ